MVEHGFRKAGVEGSTPSIGFSAAPGRGACRLPEWWKVLYRDEQGDFKPVANTTPYTTEKDTFNKVAFKPVKTDCIKIEVRLQKDWAAGIQEVIIE